MESTNLDFQHLPTIKYIPTFPAVSSFERSVIFPKWHVSKTSYSKSRTNKQTLITDPKPGLLTALLPGAGCVCVIVWQLGIFLSQDTSIAVLAANLQLLKLVILLNPG